GARRFDNGVFAALGFMNAVMAAYATVLVLTGYRMSEPFPLRTCGTLVVPIAVLSVEFGYSFPLNRPLRGRLRALLWGYAAACAALYFHPATYPWFGNVISWAFFLPAFLVMMICLARNVRGLQGERGAGWLVVAALGVRWLLGLFTFNVARYVSSSVFDAAVTFEMSEGSLICYAVIGYAFLKSPLFSVRGVPADMVVFTGLVLSILFLAAGAGGRVPGGGGGRGRAHPRRRRGRHPRPPRRRGARPRRGAAPGRPRPRAHRGEHRAGLRPPPRDAPRHHQDGAARDRGAPRLRHQESGPHDRGLGPLRERRVAARGPRRRARRRARAGPPARASRRPPAA